MRETNTNLVSKKGISIYLPQVGRRFRGGRGTLDFPWSLWSVLGVVFLEGGGQLQLLSVQLLLLSPMRLIHQSPVLCRLLPGASFIVHLSNNGNHLSTVTYLNKAVHEHGQNGAVLLGHLLLVLTQLKFDNTANVVERVVPGLLVQLKVLLSSSPECKQFTVNWERTYIFQQKVK